MPTNRELLLVIESTRRASAYDEMTRNVDTLMGTLAGDDSSSAWVMRSKITYELHMAAFQQGDYAKSLSLAERSAVEARRAGDEIGALFAEMNISGHLFPGFGTSQLEVLMSARLALEMGLLMSERVCRDAERIAGDTNPEDTNRALRVAMNCYLHQVKILMRLGAKRERIMRILDRVGDNPIFVAHRDEAWAQNALAEAHQYCLEHP